MSSDVYLSAADSARRLQIAVATLYAWLAQSDSGRLTIRGEPVTIEYFQGGARGHGRIQLVSAEIDRIRELMRVRPHFNAPRRKPSVRREQFPGITVPLGRPDS